MKYFTEDYIKEMQVSSLVTVPADSKEDWEQYVQYYIDNNIDHKKHFAIQLEFMKDDMLRFLPKYFHPYVLDGSISTEYPSDERKNKAEQWRDAYEKRSQQIRDDYFALYKQNKHLLSKNAIQLHDHSLHDAPVKSFEQPTGDIIILVLECQLGSNFHYVSDVKLTFTGVKEVFVPNEFIASIWTYHEIYPVNDGFEFYVSFSQPSGYSEFKIIAEEVTIEEMGN